jgi:hypothetical protein
MHQISHSNTLEHIAAKWIEFKKATASKDHALDT